MTTQETINLISTGPPPTDAILSAINRERELSSPISHYDFKPDTAIANHYTFSHERNPAERPEHHQSRGLEAKVESLANRVTRLDTALQELGARLTAHIDAERQELATRLEARLETRLEARLEARLEVEREELATRLRQEIINAVQKNDQRDADKRLRKMKYEIPKRFADAADEEVVKDPAIFDLIQYLEVIDAPEEITSISSLILNLYAAHTLDTNHPCALNAFNLTQLEQVMHQIPYEYLQANADHVKFLQSKRGVRWICRRGMEFWSRVSSALRTSQDVGIDINVGVYMRVESLKFGRADQAHSTLEKDKLESFFRERELNSQTLEGLPLGTRVISRAREYMSDRMV